MYSKLTKKLCIMSSVPKLNLTPSNNSPQMSDYEASQAHFTRIKFELCVEETRANQENENHLKRLANLRKELDYITSTEWMYEPIEKYIGQSQITRTPKI